MQIRFNLASSRSAFYLWLCGLDGGAGCAGASVSITYISCLMYFQIVSCRNKNFDAEICEILRVNLRLRFWKEYNFACWKFVNAIKILPFSKRQKLAKKWATKTAPVHFYTCVTQALIPAGWLQNYFNTIQTQNTFKNRNVIRYNLRMFTRIFSA